MSPQCSTEIDCNSLCIDIVGRSSLASLLMAVQTDFLSFPPAAMDKASIRSRSHGEEVSRLVDQSSDADLQGEEWRKSETDMAQSLCAPPINTSLNANDLRHVEREVPC